MQELHGTIMGRRIRLDVDFVVTAWTGTRWMEVRVPGGFVTDFASIPRLFWRILPPWGAYNRAAVAHDYLYCSHQLTKAESDFVFRWLMQDLGVAKWKRAVMYQAVRMFGGKPWKNGPKKLES